VRTYRIRMKTTYLDYAASAPADPAVIDAVAKATALVGNPSSVHAPGREVRVAVDGARAALARLLGVAERTVTFTSGATEANAIAVVGGCSAAVRGRTDGPFRVLTSPVEHASVRAAVTRAAEEFGFEIDVMPVGRDGCVDAAQALPMIGPKTVMVTLTWAHNVLGTVQPVAEIGAAVAAERARRGAAGLPMRFHVDAVQALPSLEMKLGAVGADYVSVSSHKICGPKGVGALVRPGMAAIDPLYGGGGQEDGVRSGTENVAGIVGFGVAADVLASRRSDDARHAAALRRRLIDGLSARVPFATVVGDAATTIPGTAFIVCKGVPGERAAMLLDAAGFAMSAGSACDAGSRKPSSALIAALGETAAVHGGVRVSFGRFSTENDIDALLGAIASLRK
jgi:cysteine desulfurase